MNKEKQSRQLQTCVPAARLRQQLWEKFGRHITGHWRFINIFWRKKSTEAIEATIATGAEQNHHDKFTVDNLLQISRQSTAEKSTVYWRHVLYSLKHSLWPITLLYQVVIYFLSTGVSIVCARRRVCLCTQECMSVYTGVHVCAHNRACLCTSMHTNVFVCAHMRAYLCTQACLSVHTGVHICAHRCVCLNYVWCHNNWSAILYHAYAICSYS